MAFPSSENTTRVVELPEQYLHMMTVLIALLFASRLKAGPQAERDLDARICTYSFLRTAQSLN